MSLSETTTLPVPGVDLTQLEGMTGFLLRLAQLRVYDGFHAALGAHGITPTRYSLLSVLHGNPGSRPGQIAEALRVKPSNLAALLAQFEADGLIERLTDPAERRAVLIRLTEAGTALFDAIHPLVLAQEARVMASLSVPEQAELRRLLRRVATTPE
jgi:DNA-binding MarR family transcriptional regulator